jgi:hypothetical protein
MGSKEVRLRRRKGRLRIEQWLREGHLGWWSWILEVLVDRWVGALCMC